MYYQLNSVRYPGEEVQHLIIRCRPGSYYLLRQFVHAPDNNDRPKHSYDGSDGSQVDMI